MSNTASPAPLPRTLGLWGAVLLGLGSIVGTGVFVSLGLAAGVAGYAMLWAIPVAAALALCNGLSSAQLAAAHPVSGGTYEYGYTFLHPYAGFAAGWLFLCAKSASAATAALGIAGYLPQLLGYGSGSGMVSIAITSVIFVTLIVRFGLRPSAVVNAILVAISTAALVCFATICFTDVSSPGISAVAAEAFRPEVEVSDFLFAVALIFVAYTGYGRIATLGEEVREPARTIPRAIGVTVLAALTIYLIVAWAALSAVGPSSFAAFVESRGAPLSNIATELQASRWAVGLVGAGAITALGGVLLNLILGLSRVYLAMARRGDLPALLGTIDVTGTTPTYAVLLAGFVVALLAWMGDIRSAWSFSAFTVLLYYALTNLCALRLDPAQRMFPAWVSILGLAGCVGLAAWVPFQTWRLGLGILALGFLTRGIGRRVWL